MWASSETGSETGYLSIIGGVQSTGTRREVSREQSEGGASPDHDAQQCGPRLGQCGPPALQAPKKIPIGTLDLQCRQSRFPSQARAAMEISTWLRTERPDMLPFVNSMYVGIVA